MSEDDQAKPDVDHFLKDQIDTVPHLEALLLLWNSRPKPWSAQEMAKDLYLTPEAARDILDDLVRRRLIQPVSPGAQTYRYEPEPSQDQLMAALDSTYRRELIRITRLIHSKPSAAIRAFARAFRIKQDRD